jgi:chaperonin cofactor prefoldin
MNAQLSSLTQEYQSEHSQLKQLVHSKQRIDSQLAENESVQEQLTHIKKEDQSASTVFKSIGHVLIKQEFSESLSNVNRRIHFLKNEQCVLIHY